MNSSFMSASLCVVIKHLVAADGEQDVLLGNLEACGEHGFEVSFIPVLPKTGYFPSAGHLHAEHHVSSSQPREGKLRDLQDIWFKGVCDGP